LQAARISFPMHPPITQEVTNEFMQSLLSGDRREGARIIQDLLFSGVPVQRAYEEVIKKALYHVGELWEHNQITVAEEHLATSVSEAIMNELFPALVSRARTNRKVLLGCVENELHQVGVKMVADVFEMKGWDTFFLGTGIPVHEMIRYAKSLRPDLFALSISIYFHLPVLEAMIGQIRQEFPETNILVGGQGFRHGGREVLQNLPGVLLIDDLYSLEQYIDGLAETG